MKKWLIWAILCIFGVSEAFAITPNENATRIRNFKGLVTNVASNLIEDNQSPYMLNMGVVNGWLQPLPGFTRVSATPITAATKDEQYAYLHGTEYVFDDSDNRLERESDASAISALSVPSAPTVDNPDYTTRVIDGATDSTPCDSVFATEAFDPNLSEEGTYAFFQTVYIPSKDIESEPSAIASVEVTHTCYDNNSGICGGATIDCWEYKQGSLTTAALDTDWGADAILKVYGGGAKGFGLFGTFTSGSTTVKMTKIPQSTGTLPEVFVPIAPPSGAGYFIFTYSDSLFIGGDTSVHWSTFKTNNTAKLAYSEEYSLDFDTSIDDDQDTLEGGLGTAQFAVVYSKNKMWGISGSSWSSFKNSVFLLNENAGGTNEYAAVKDNKGSIYIFGGDSGITRITQRFEIENIAYPIMDVLLGTNTDIVIDTSKYDSVRTLFDPIREWVWFFVTKSGSSFNDMALIWDTKLEQWYVKDNIPGRAAWKEVDADGQISLYTIDDDGYQFQISENAFEDYDMDGTQTGNPTSAVSSGQAVVTDTGASFTTDGKGWTDAYIILVEGTTIEKKQISSNTATAVTATSNWSNSFTTAATYYIGYQDCIWESKWFDNGSIDTRTKIEQPSFSFTKASSTHNVYITPYIDYDESSSPKETETLDISTNYKPHNLSTSVVSHYTKFKIQSITGTINPQVREIVLPIQEKGRI